MRCGECGREIEDGSRYCPWCGATSSFTPSGRRSGGKRTAMLAALAVVALVIVAAFVASMDNNRTDDKTLNPSTQPDGGSTVVFTDGVYYVSGKDADLFEFELTEKDGARQLVVTLNESVASQYGSFTWYINDESKWPWGYQQIEKTEPVLYWTLNDDAVGDFSVGVVCRESSGFPSFLPTGGTEYSVDVSIDGTYIQQYSWTYQGESYQLSIDYTYSEFIDVSGSNGASLAKRMGYGNGTYSGMAFGIAYAPTIEGPYTVMNDRQPIMQMKDGTDDLMEDPFFWKDGKGYHLIYKDHRGKFTGEIGGGVMAHSENGIDWHLDKSPKAYSRTVEWEDGSVSMQGQLERPFILFDGNGRMRCIFFATMDGPGGFGNATKSWNMVIPVNQ